MLPRIFDAFEQGEPRVTRAASAAWGWAWRSARPSSSCTAGELTAASGGRGRGATFTVSPAGRPCPAGDRGAGPAPAAIPEPSAEIADRTASHILLVEDHADTAEAMADLLR